MTATSIEAAVGAGNHLVDEAGGVLEQDAGGLTLGVALDAARGWVLALADGGSRDGRAAQPARVVVVRPEGHGSAGGRLVQESGAGPAPESVEGPAVAEQPASRVALPQQPFVRSGDRRP